MEIDYSYENMDLHNLQLVSLSKAMDEDDFSIVENMFDRHPDKVSEIDLDKLISTIERFSCYLDVIQDVISIDPRVSLLDIALLLRSGGFKELYWALMTERYSRVSVSPAKIDLPGTQEIDTYAEKFERMGVARVGKALFCCAALIRFNQCPMQAIYERQRIANEAVMFAFALFPFLSDAETEMVITRKLEQELQNSDCDKTLFHALKYSRSAFLTAQAGDFAKTDENVLRARIELDQLSLSSRMVYAYFFMAASSAVIFTKTGLRKYKWLAINDIDQAGQILSESDYLQEKWNGSFRRLLNRLHARETISPSSF